MPVTIEHTKPKPELKSLTLLTENYAKITAVCKFGLAMDYYELTFGVNPIISTPPDGIAFDRPACIEAMEFFRTLIAAFPDKESLS